MLDSKDVPDCWCLIWEWGGDWTCFGDDVRHDAEQLDDWMPGAVREAVTAAVKSNPACESDMDWFVEWADDAERTLEGSEDA